MAQLTVGLDIGTSAVRAAELDVGQPRPVLRTYGQVGLPPGSLVDGEIRDVSAVTEAITRLWKNGQFSSSTVIVGIAGLRAITREIDLPYVPDNEVDSAVRFQSEEVIPFPPDQTILSSQVLADYTSPDGDKMRRVLVAAAHVDLVNGVIEAVEKAGLTVDGRRPDLVGPRARHRRPGCLRAARGDRFGRVPGSPSSSSTSRAAPSSSGPSAWEAMPRPQRSPRHWTYRSRTPKESSGASTNRFPRCRPPSEPPKPA